MIEVRRTEAFVKWAEELRDAKAIARITVRIARLRAGNFSDVKRLTSKVSELRVDYGPGYRVYFTMHGNTLVILLCGGNKTTQRKDIALAERLAEDL